MIAGLSEFSTKLMTASAGSGNYVLIDVKTRVGEPPGRNIEHGQRPV